MDLNPADWSHAQNLLLKLVQALSPLAVRPVVPSEFLSRRFFIPPLASPAANFFQRHPVKILMTLHQVQKEVGDWIGESANPVDTQPSETVPEKPVCGEAKKSKQPLNPGEEFNNRGREKEIVQEPVKPVLREKNSIPLAKQAKELIHQVQEAIGRLANSTYIQEPSEAPLRDLLKKLKPNLDRIIETVVVSQEKPSSDHPFRHPLPIPVREEAIKKLYKIKEENSILKTPNLTKLAEKPDSPASVQLSIRRNPISDKKPPESKKVSKSEQEEVKPIRNSKKEKKILELSDSRSEKKQSLPIQKTENLTPKEADVRLEKKEQTADIKQEIKPVSLPITPVLPQSKASVRKKKKRKSFWFKDEEKDPSDR